LEFTRNRSNLFEKRQVGIFIWNLKTKKYQNQTSNNKFWAKTTFGPLIFFFFFRYTILLQDVEDYVLLHAWVFTKIFT
jgi:hypothetical protein